MSSTETQIAVIKTQMENIEKKVEAGFLAQKEDTKRLEGMFIEFMEKSETRFADKWVEKAVSWAGYFIIGTVLTALMALVVTNAK